MTEVVDFTDSIGIGPMDVWVQVEVVDADPEVGIMQPDFLVLAVYAVDEETNRIKGVDMCGSYSDEQHKAWGRRAIAELARKRREAAEDAAIERYETEQMWRKAA